MPNRTLKNQPPREWLVYKEDGGLDFTGQPRTRYMLLTHVEGSEKWYWSGGYTWTTPSEDWELVKSYGVFSYDSEFEETICNKFDEEYRTPVAVDPTQLIGEYREAPEGWLAPDGKWYPVEYGGHTAEASYLCRLVVKVAEEYYSESYTYLHKNGWVSIHQGYILTDGNEGLTYPQAMLDTLKVIESVATDEKYLRHLSETMKRVLP